MRIVGKVEGVVPADESVVQRGPERIGGKDKNQDHRKRRSFPLNARSGDARGFANEAVSRGPIGDHAARVARGAASRHVMPTSPSRSGTSARPTAGSASCVSRKDAR